MPITLSDELILVLDEGTTSTRALLFARDGTPHAMAQRELTQHYPRDGWVEHDAGEIWAKTLACAQEVVAQEGGAQAGETQGGGARAIAAIAITNQRETVVAWDRETGAPLCRAIVWQDRRTAEYCEQLKAAGHEEPVRAKTGLLLDPYFSASKMRWMLDNQPAVADAARAGRLAFGTVESWLVFKLTGGALHITDASNASRTLLLPLAGQGWDAQMCELFGVPQAALPKVVDNAGELGFTDPALFGAAIPICALVGDQQAATIGQGCIAPGETKATYGTGAFVLASTGRAVPQSKHRLLSTVLCQLDGERLYALEGAMFVAGSLVQYLRDTLGLIDNAEQTEGLARSIANSGGVVVIPALSGLGAPHWRPDARASISGLSFATGRAHIVRAALEAMAHQTHDLAAAFAADGARWTGIRIDGGMAANDWMAQDIADLLDIPVTRPEFVETTALGAAMLASVGCGWHTALESAAQAMIGKTSVFEPRMDESVRSARLAQWEQALARS